MISDEYQDEPTEALPVTDLSPAPEGAVPLTTSEAPAPAISDGVWSAATSSWISAHVRNSPIAQSVEAWTHLGTILPRLRALLEAELSK